MKHTYTKAEDALKALYDKITDWFEVEDWTDPCKGITEVEAHFNALDGGMEAWSTMAGRVAAAEDRLHDALKAYEDTAQELHECQTERDRLREQLRLSIIDAANNEAEANELRPLAIGGDGSTHWYYRDEYERLHAEVRERERKAFVAGAYYGWDHGRTLSETLFDADGVSKERYP